MAAKRKSRSERGDADGVFFLPEMYKKAWMNVRASSREARRAGGIIDQRGGVEFIDSR